MAHEECPMAGAVRTGRPVRGLAAIAERPDGTRVHFIPYPTLTTDAAGRVTGGVNVLVDITELKNAEEALAEQELSLVAALAEKELLLRARNETIRQLETTQAQLTSVIEASHALMGAGEREAGVLPILRITQQLLSADAFAMWAVGAEPEEWRITLSEGLSERYIATSTLRARAEVERPLPTFVVEDVASDPRLAARVAAYEEEGIRSVCIVPLETKDDVFGTVAFYFRNPHAFSDLEVRVGTALANLASASLAAERLFDANEAAREALSAANGELREIAAELRVANAAKDEFLGLVSHELKTPLTTVRGNAEVLLRTYDRIDAGTRATALRDIVAESDRLQRIIENLLLLARSEQRDGSDVEPVIVRRIVRKVVERHRIRRPNRVFVFAESDESRPVLCSEACIEQVVENFLSNAEKYSDPAEPIYVDVSVDGLEVAVRVMDGGDGIDAGESDRLFEPFYRSNRARGRAEGLGIGLAVSKRLVDANGGRIWARARETGGAEFGFAFPILDDEALELP